LPEYVRRHRCLLAGAEAALLRELYREPDYHRHTGGFWHEGTELHFHQVREDGRHMSENLDRIKDDLATEMRRLRCDTLLLSLGTGAKIVCQELAAELHVRAIDFGSMLRALTYSGSSGYHANRAFHNPFLFRVPFSLYMTALERAHPSLEVATLIGKAHSQLALEIQDLRPGGFNTVDVGAGPGEIDAERLGRFRAAHREYVGTYYQRAKNDAVASDLHREFVRWRRKRGIGLDGRVFLWLVKLKGALRRVLGGRLVPAPRQG
jgi:hypothetical protein